MKIIMKNRKIIAVFLCVVLSLLLLSMPVSAIVKGCGSTSLIYSGKFKMKHNFATNMVSCSAIVNEQTKSEEWDFSLPNCLPKNKDAVVLKKCIDIEGSKTKAFKFSLNDDDDEKELKKAKWEAEKDNTLLIYTDLEEQVDGSDLENFLTCPVPTSDWDIEFFDTLNEWSGKIGTYDIVGTWLSEKMGYYGEYYCLLEVSVPMGYVSFPSTTGGSTGGTWTGTVEQFTKSNIEAGTYMKAGGVGGSSYSAGSNSALGGTTFTTDGSIVGGSSNSSSILASIGSTGANITTSSGETGASCVSGKCCVNGKLAGSNVECDSTESYGCRDSQFSPEYASVKTYDDKSNAYPNSDVYVREVKTHCSGDSADCNGEANEVIEYYKKCETGSTCELDSKECSVEKLSSECLESSECFESNQYKWTGNSCSHTCSTECKFAYTGTTICSAPGSVSGKRLTGVSSETSSCFSNDYCYSGVSCSSSGAIQGVKGDVCLDAGNSEGESCFILGSSAKCSDSGICNNKEEFLTSCVQGSASSEFCATGNSCFYDINCEIYGWDYKESIDLMLSTGEFGHSCNDDCLNKGFILDSSTNTCFYNIRCDKDKGWVSSTEVCHPNGIEGNYCYTNYGCSISGCTTEKLPKSRC